jgi:AraC-like DNA-binding protein
VLYIELSDVYVQQKRQRNPTDNQQEKISQLEDLIDRNYKSLKFPKEYAELMNMSQKHLNRIVKLNLNKTISALISDRVVLEAKRMLLHSSSSISQIAFELGYIENGYFFRLFKNKTGQTPTEFLNEFNKN